VRIYYFLILFVLSGCIGFDIVEDEVEPVVVVLNPIDSLKIDDQYQLEAMYLNNVGLLETVDINWSTSDKQIISVTSTGLIEAITEGKATIIAEYESASDTLEIYSGTATSVIEMGRAAELTTVSSYPLSGTVFLEVNDEKTVLSFSDNFKTTSALPGLYVYLSNNINTTAGAFEVGAVTSFSGAQEYEINSSVGINDYSHVLFFCKPFNVAVGNGAFNP